MKRILFLLLGLSTMFVATAQYNTVAENSFVKLEFAGFINGQTIVKVTNNQACDASIKVWSTVESSTKTYAGFASDTVRLTLSGAQAKVWAHVLTNCAKPGRDTEVLVLTLNIDYLPIKFTRFYIRKQGGTN